MKNLYTEPKLKISVFGEENVVTTASNLNAREIEKDWFDLASITEVRFKDLKYVKE